MHIFFSNLKLGTISALLVKFKYNFKKFLIAIL